MIHAQGDDQPKRPAQSAEEEQAGGVYGPQGTPLLRQQVRPHVVHFFVELVPPFVQQGEAPCGSFFY